MLVALLVAAAPAASASPPLYGVAVAGDGDSLTIGETRVRLFGIDAPEFDQECTRGGARWACGKAAADQLAKLVTRREVRCLPTGTDRYARVVARCSVEGIDVNLAMVAGGYAVAFRRYSTDYVSAEESAKVARRGMWSGTFEMPAEVRAAAARQMGARPVRARPSGATTAWAQRGQCVIKGNHSRRGEYIYHLPGMPYYEQTRPEAIFVARPKPELPGTGEQEFGRLSFTLMAAMGGKRTLGAAQNQRAGNSAVIARSLPVKRS